MHVRPDSARGAAISLEARELPALIEVLNGACGDDSRVTIVDVAFARRLRDDLLDMQRPRRSEVPGSPHGKASPTSRAPGVDESKTHWNGASG